MSELPSIARTAPKKFSTFRVSIPFARLRFHTSFLYPGT